MLAELRYQTVLLGRIVDALATLQAQPTEKNPYSVAGMGAPQEDDGPNTNPFIGS